MTRAFWVTAAGRGELRSQTLGRPEENEVLVRALYSGISRGTETLVLRGEVPPSEYERMRAPFQQGDFPAPVKYGYISVGEVEQGPPSLQGRPVFCLHPHQEHYIVPATAVTPLPDDVPPGRAVLAANLETAINGLWDAAPRIGDRVSVVGGGAVGCLMAWLAAGIAGCEVELVDTRAGRRQQAEALGVSFAVPAAARPDADLVIHASGSSAGLNTALALAGAEATIIEMSWFGTRSVSVDLGGAFHSRRLTLRASQVGQVATAQRARWDYARRMALALRLLADPALDCLITGETPFDGLPDLMSQLAGTGDDTICHRIVYPH